MSTLCWFLCLILLFFAYVMKPAAGLLAVLILFAAAPVISWLILWKIRKKIQVQIQVPGIAGKKKPYEISLKTKGAARIPLGKTVLWVQMTNRVTEEVQKKRLVFREREKWTLESLYCGCIEYEILDVFTYDIFGVLPLKLNIHERKRTVVMPDTFPVEIDSILSASDLEECREYAPDRRGKDPTEIFQVREYVPGDQVKQIHWKLSGKLEKLMVRDPSEPVDRELMVFLDRTGENIAPDRADALMEAVTSVCQALAEAAIPFHLVWNEEVIASYEISHKEQLPEAIAAMLKSKPVKQEISGSDLYGKTRGKTVAGAVLYFCLQLPNDPFPEARVQTFVCGRGADATEFTTENKHDVLKKISWS